METSSKSSSNNPWKTPTKASDTEVSFEELMSEELAKNLQERFFWKLLLELDGSTVSVNIDIIVDNILC